MSTSELSTHDLSELTREVAHLHKEVSVLRQQLLGIANYVHDHIDDARHDGSADLIHCHNCGAPVAAHVAASGQLLLCPACGWSEFVSRDGRESSEVQPDRVPLIPTPHGWTD
ncbi:hypothetical protein [Magnetospirillum sp. 64-120]|uniref:hypothetical protein n=1 Tax=Magnetospirillum sp. 64-120 TaxID=1895778 RepID=UPI0025C28793|nr:hypothetical protein [Magnetospirillum sp. 64-120]